MLSGAYYRPNASYIFPLLVINNQWNDLFFKHLLTNDKLIVLNMFSRIGNFVKY